MRGARTTTIAAVAALGVALVGRPDPLYAEPSGGMGSGPAAAIAKARAAADQAGDRARESDAEADTALDTNVTAERQAKARAKTKGKSRAEGEDTAGSVADETAPQDQASASREESAPSQRTYDVAAHRDPFKPPRLGGAINARTPLEKYQIGQLKLVGVVAQSPEGYRAMVEDSAGLGYIITTGTPIGSSGGVVRSIEPRRVVIEESTRDFYGDVKAKEVVMELPQEDRSP